MGESGTGKTTLIDLITGLIQPNKGKILCDNKIVNTNNLNWRKKIGYVAQSTFNFWPSNVFVLVIKKYKKVIVSNEYKHHLRTFLY